MNKATYVSIDILNVSGGIIASLIHEKQTSGQHVLYVDAGSKGLSAGNYFAKMNVDGNVLLKPIVVQ